MSTKKDNTDQKNKWSTHSTHKTFESADAARNDLAKNSQLKVKVRRKSSCFQVKTCRLGVEKKVDTPKTSDDNKRKTRSKEELPKTRAQRRAEKMRRKAAQTKNL